MKLILKTAMIFSLLLACQGINAQTKPAVVKKPVNHFGGGDFGQQLKNPRSKPVNQFGGDDFGQQRKAKPKGHHHRSRGHNKRTHHKPKH